MLADERERLGGNIAFVRALVRATSGGDENTDSPLSLEELAARALPEPRLAPDHLQPIVRRTIGVSRTSVPEGLRDLCKEARMVAEVADRPLHEAMAAILRWKGDLVTAVCWLNADFDVRNLVSFELENT